ncbi:MAG: APC family permease [Herpetosiphonaceae bacterium]|nr:APC family permease [Herpetosiphonaceae bacterium]
MGVTPEERQVVAEPERHAIRELLVGRPLDSASAAHQTIRKFVALPVFASDALSSVAYATEEILRVLALAGGVGLAAFSLSIPISVIIVGLLIVLTLSYRQTIFAYPSGGGAYIVARDNLGESPAQVAGAALLTDYILTVSVSIAAGVAQITSAFPMLTPFRVEICLALIWLMTVVNLRGVKESGAAFAGPTYFFLGMTALLLLTGFWQLTHGSLGTVTDVRMNVIPITSTLTILLLLRAFSSGCTALTGVEAISNGIPAFKEPKSRNAATTMAFMSGILGVTFIGITVLARRIQAVPADETVISQLARTIFGRGPLYFAMAAATTAVLIMAANTSFADFPRLSALQAGDGFLPRQLTNRGSRLVFSWGILALAILASLLILLFNGDVSRLIPLYAIGVFLSFTLSQLGMVIRWRKVSRLRPDEEIQSKGTVLRPDRWWWAKGTVNGLGALLSLVVTLVFAFSKFTEGAWVTVLLIPSLVWLFFRIHKHYRDTARALSLEKVCDPDLRGHAIETILLIDNVHRGTLQQVRFAESLGRPWIAVHIGADSAKAERTRERWNQFVGHRGELTVIESPYRNLVGPVQQLIKQFQAENPGVFINVVLGQLVTTSWWTQLLHQNTGPLFKFTLQRMHNVVVTDVHYLLEPDGTVDV